MYINSQYGELGDNSLFHPCLLNDEQVVSRLLILLPDEPPDQDQLGNRAHGKGGADDDDERRLADVFIDALSGAIRALAGD